MLTRVANRIRLFILQTFHVDDFSVSIIECQLIFNHHLKTTLLPKTWLRFSFLIFNIMTHIATKFFICNELSIFVQSRYCEPDTAI